MAVNWNSPLQAALEAALPRPDPKASAAEKKNYAERLSRALAETMADALRTRKAFRGVTPHKGKGHEAPTKSADGKKKLDVRLLNEELGLVFTLSIKTYSFRDYSPKNDTFGRYQKNIVRNDHELRGEADVIHRRQPYAVMVAVMFMHEGATTDGENKHSSFAHAVFTLRKRAGRSSPHDPRPDRFEKVYIGLFDPTSTTGAVRFFDVENAPPRNGMPNHTLTLRQLVDVIDDLVAIRNETVLVYDDGGSDEVDLAEMTVEDLAGNLEDEEDEATA